MSRRRVARRPEKAVRARPERVAEKADGSFYFRPIAGSSSTKDYRCPGCAQLIRQATPHVVAWPVEKALLSESAIDERRHWHTACWSRRH
ncbi:hypothetical protein [Aeromicrobium sp.]|uniref:hypothetical protein n=1 Tax=Aeromicrobium sp. TaxID=1871063 RepID=UPI0019CBEDB1|nr:hypothetical protein [Aeromicrobium sp.]MBC7630001.1 hypothetical protein [Aeromicrobium sp.]